MSGTPMFEAFSAHRIDYQQRLLLTLVKSNIDEATAPISRAIVRAKFRLAIPRPPRTTITIKIYTYFEGKVTNWLASHASRRFLPPFRHARAAAATRRTPPRASPHASDITYGYKA